MRDELDALCRFGAHVADRVLARSRRNEWPMCAAVIGRSRRSYNANALSPDSSVRVRCRRPERSGGVSRRACSITTVRALGRDRLGLLERRRERGRPVRWIEEDEIEPGAHQPRRRTCKVHADNSIALRDAAVREVLGNERGGARVVLHEGDVGRAAAQRLDADGAGAGEGVEDPRAVEPLPEHVEQRLAQAIRCRPQSRPGRRAKAASLECTGDDANSCDSQRRGRRLVASRLFVAALSVYPTPTSPNRCSQLARTNAVSAGASGPSSAATASRRASSIS